MRFYIQILLFLISTSSFSQSNKELEIFFSSNEYCLSDNQIQKIKSYVVSLDKYDVMKLTIDGFADKIGKEEDNLILSGKRAIEVYGIVKQYIKDTTKIKRVNGNGEITIYKPANDLSKGRKVRIVAFVKGNNKLSDLEAGRLKVGDKLVLDNILFQGGRHFLLSGSDTVVKKLVKILKEQPKYNILIEGHICCRPSGEDGLDIDTQKKNLSEARAKYVYDYIIREGISASRLKYVGYGGKYPTGKGDKFDRRVELKIISN